MKKKPVTSIIMGKPTIGMLLMMAKGLIYSFDLLLREYECLPNMRGSLPVDHNTIKMMGLAITKNMILPFICELSLTALYLLDNPKVINVPKKHSLLYWWQHLKIDTKKNITEKFKETMKEKWETKEKKPEEILKQNDKSHTEWRYWWRKGFATGGPSSIAMQYLTEIIINLAEIYLKQKGNRNLPGAVDGFKAFEQERTKRGID